MYKKYIEKIYSMEIIFFYEVIIVSYFDLKATRFQYKNDENEEKVV